MSGFDINKRALFNRLTNNSETLLRPPWAIDEYDFVEQCNACGDCVTVCEQQIIKLDQRHQPYIDFSQDECTFCQNCLKSCKTGALTTKEPPWHAKAHISSQCLAEKKVMCRTCEDACDLQAIKFDIGGISKPSIYNELCNGCGACVSVCPSNAIAIQTTHQNI